MEIEKIGYRRFSSRFTQLSRDVQSPIKAGVNVNLSEILVSLKRG